MVDKPEKQVRVLIVSLPGMMQSVLRETFMRRADVDLVGVASGCFTAANMIQQSQPDLVVIDSNLPEDEANQLIVHLKQEHLSVRSLVLVETTQQLNSATSERADISLLSYSLLDSLDSVLGNMNAN